MGQPEALIVPQFKGIHRPSRLGKLSTRRRLDEPREMYNLHIDGNGHLYMPHCPDVLHDFSSDGDWIRTLHYTETPQGLVVQLNNGKIYFIGRVPGSGDWFPDPIDPDLLATIPSGEEDNNLWVNSTRDGYFLMGYAPRGSAGATDGITWKVAGDHTSYTVTALSDTNRPSASYSTMYKGRRFWMKRSRDVWFTALNEIDGNFEDTFGISGDDAGTSFIDNPGNAMGLVSWEDVLIFMLTGSIWVLTGSAPENYNLRQVQTNVGNFNSWSVARTNNGVIHLGGRNIHSRGVYLFTGSGAQNISENIEDYMVNVGHITSTMMGDHYILGTSRTGEDNRQFLILDTRNGQWVAFDGFTRGTATAFANTIVLSKEAILYQYTSFIFPRPPGRGASLRIGYHDDENPSGLVRYLGVKLTGRKWGTGTPTVKVTATTSDTQKVSAEIDLPTDVFDNVVIPLNIRGAGVEFFIEFTPANDDNEILIENLQVITSRKGEKVSRG